MVDEADDATVVVLPTRAPPGRRTREQILALVLPRKARAAAEPRFDRPLLERLNKLALKPRETPLRLQMPWLSAHTELSSKTAAPLDGLLASAWATTAPVQPGSSKDVSELQLRHRAAPARP